LGRGAGEVGEGQGTLATERARQRRVWPLDARRRPPKPAGPIPQGSARAVRTRDTVYRRALAAADVSAAALAIVVAIELLGDNALKPLALLTLPLVVLISKVLRLYERDEQVVHKTTLDEAPMLFQVATIYTLLLWLGAELFVAGWFGKSQVLGLWGILFVSMVAGRAIARQLVDLTVSPERCLVLGDAESASELERKLQGSFSVRARIVGRVPFETQRDGDGDPAVVATLDTLGVALVEHEIDRVIIAPRRSDSDEILDAIRVVKSLGVKVSVLPRLFEVVGSSVTFDNVDGLTLLGLPTYGLTASSRVLKRGMDVVGSSISLVVLAPLFAWVALGIRLTSPGPVLFRQTRIGRDGEEFQMLKFRTMRDGADEHKAELAELNEAAEGLFKISDDPRVTTIGRFLRRSSLDELPQLINVLRGEMSLVGPRPLVPDEDRKVEGWQRNRLQIKPGMTGLWQIFGSSRIPLQEMVKIDYLYTANWSLWVDVKTLLRTVPYVFSRRGL
jgi:exopolysaccharide biosynthesis polyprenyl glycosylphosphotransferase